MIKVGKLTYIFFAFIGMRNYNGYKMNNNYGGYIVNAFAETHKLLHLDKIPNDYKDLTTNRCC